MYTYRIEQAIKAAAVLHKNQVRQGAFPVPYITHLISVSLLLADYTDNEDILVAAILHDTLEDTDYTLKELITDFGNEVSHIVQAVTEPKNKDWSEKKAQYLKQITKAGEQAQLVACADKIHNIRSVLEEYYETPGRYLKDFGRTEERFIQYQQLSNLFNRVLKNDIVHEFNRVFTEYKKFNEHVEKHKQAHIKQKMGF